MSGAEAVVFGTGVEASVENVGPEQPAAAQVFTICAPNYLAQACVLGASLIEHHPGTRLTVFLIGALPTGFTVPPALEILPAAKVLAPAEWHHRSAYYSILELATSIKPACFRFLFDRGARVVTYFDPDIRFHAPMPEIMAEAGPPLLLTPHILTPLPEDGLVPANLTILKAGTYNLGFAQLRRSDALDGFLAWWDERLHRHCLEDASSGAFTDQRWMDMAPVLVPGTEILRHPGCNLAYWNLHERAPRLRDGAWLVEGPGAARTVPLVFGHFSGFVPGRPELSKHENRFGQTPPGDMALLLKDYAEALGEAGNAALSRLRAFDVRLSCGASWDGVMRRLYRQALAQGIALDNPLSDDRMLAWARERAPNDHVSRYARMVLTLRPDIAAATRDGHDQERLANWISSYGIRELDLDAAMLGRLGINSTLLTTGVGVVGYVTSQLGVGEAARNAMRALEAVRIPVRPHDISWMAASPRGQYDLPSPPTGGPAPDTTIICCNADQLPWVLPVLPPDIRATRRIGYWHWETTDFPEEWCDRFALVDEVWVASEFVADAVRLKSTVPVAVMPPPVDPPKHERDRAWLTRQIPACGADEFVFLFQFDVLSVPFRKNPEAVIAAFVEAFRPEDPVRLIVKLLNVDGDPALVARLRRRAGQHRVSFFDTVLSSEERFRLLASIDCFASLHRAEGFGLSIAEAMACGRPVLVTGWSGNMDFTTAANAALVDYDLVVAEDAHGPYPAGTVWAEIRIHDAAAKMRRMVEDAAWRQALAEAGAQSIRRLLAPGIVGARMMNCLQRVASRSRAMAASPGQPEVPLAARPGAGRVIAMLLIDVASYPGYYLSRVPRLPRLLLDGPRAFANRFELVVASAPQHKAQFSIRSMLRSLFGRFVPSAEQRNTG